jgi:peroxin-6
MIRNRFTIADRHFNADDFVRSCPLNLTGADFYALASHAYLCAIRRLIAEKRTDPSVTLMKEDFDHALACFTPSMNIHELQQYEKLH